MVKRTPSLAAPPLFPSDNDRRLIPRVTVDEVVFRRTEDRSRISKENDYGVNDIKGPKGGGKGRLKYSSFSRKDSSSIGRLAYRSCR